MSVDEYLRSFLADNSNKVRILALPNGVGEAEYLLNKLLDDWEIISTFNHPDYLKFDQRNFSSKSPTFLIIKKRKTG